MLLPLFLLFTLLPVLELMLLFKAGDAIGGLNTLAIVIVTGLLGAHFARSQGRQILSQIQLKAQSGEMPTDDLIHGLLVFGGGLLLVTPGFVTDITGLAMVFPLSRTMFVHVCKKYFSGKVQVGGAGFSNTSPFGSVHVRTVSWDAQAGKREVETMRDVTPRRIKDLNNPESPKKATD